MTQQATTKAPYHTPKLTEHGTIRSMTNTASNTGPNDSAGAGSYTS